MSDCGEVTETETVLHALLATRLLLLGALWKKTKQKQTNRKSLHIRIMNSVAHSVSTATEERRQNIPVISLHLYRLGYNSTQNKGVVSQFIFKKLHSADTLNKSNV